MTATRFQLLLERLPQVADVINRFQSAELQRDVLQALLKALECDAAEADGGDPGPQARLSAADSGIDRSALDDLGSVVLGHGLDLVSANDDASSIHDA